MRFIIHDTNVRSTDLKCDGSQGCAHAPVQCGRPTVADDLPEDADGRARPRVLLPYPEGVERVTRDHPGGAAEPAGHEFSAPAARKKLRPEIHYPQLQ